MRPGGKSAIITGGGRLDILVNNAGIAHHRAFLDMPVEEWERVMRTNLTGMFLCAQAAARVMVEAGSIVNVDGSFDSAGLIFSMDELRSLESEARDPERSG